jgi:EAL domain-containing protein (putative c-di-GMP-specific phosphodiesterase class I)/CheY-like chemotaxis protein
MERPDTLLPMPARAGDGKVAVLVVDDDPIVGRALKRVLEQREIEVTVAGDGSAATAALMQRAFDVVLSDVRMPGMSGIDLLSVVRAYDLDVPVLLMTAVPSLDTAIEAVRLGATEYLVKPVDTEVLVASIARAAKLHEDARTRREAQRPRVGPELGAADRAELQARFERAIESLWLAYQPIVDFGKRKVFGYEALVRSKEPSMEEPSRLLGAAERLGHLRVLGRKIRAAAATAFDAAPPDATLFVNVHPRDLLDPQLFERDAPLSRMASRVVLEITERTALQEVTDARARVAVLRYLGFRIAIDDLGAGYAGLASFASLAPEIVKLDVSLVRGIHQSEVRQRLVTSMTSLCVGLGMRVVAEGIETPEERDCLADAGCELLQGFLFAEPGPAFPRARMLS